MIESPRVRQTLAVMSMRTHDAGDKHGVEAMRAAWAASLSDELGPVAGPDAAQLQGPAGVAAAGGQEHATAMASVLQRSGPVTATVTAGAAAAAAGPAQTQGAAQAQAHRSTLNDVVDAPASQQQQLASSQQAPCLALAAAELAAVLAAPASSAPRSESPALPLQQLVRPVGPPEQPLSQLALVAPPPITSLLGLPLPSQPAGEPLIPAQQQHTPLSASAGVGAGSQQAGLSEATAAEADLAIDMQHTVDQPFDLDALFNDSFDDMDMGLPQDLLPSQQAPAAVDVGVAGFTYTQHSPAHVPASNPAVATAAAAAAALASDDDAQAPMAAPAAREATCLAGSDAAAPAPTAAALALPGPPAHGATHATKAGAGPPPTAATASAACGLMSDHELEALAASLLNSSRRSSNINAGVPSPHAPGTGNGLDAVAHGSTGHGSDPMPRKQRGSSAALAAGSGAVGGEGADDGSGKEEGEEEEEEEEDQMSELEMGEGSELMAEEWLEVGQEEEGHVGAGVTTVEAGGSGGAVLGGRGSEAAAGGGARGLAGAATAAGALDAGVSLSRKRGGAAGGDGDGGGPQVAGSGQRQPAAHHKRVLDLFEGGDQPPVGLGLMSQAAAGGQLTIREVRGVAASCDWGSVGMSDLLLLWCEI